MSHVRPSWHATLEEALPYSVKVLMNAYRLARGGVAELYAEIPMMPASANKMYRKAFTKGGHQGFYLDKDVKLFRDMAMAKMWGKRFTPRATVGCILVFETSGWITKEQKIRKRDADNPVKCALDAISQAINLPDEMIWDLHVSKLVSRRDAAHVWMFDLGDVVPAVGGTGALL